MVAQTRASSLDAERARRQYDAVEPENRLVARSLERVWEERLRRVDRVEQEYDAWRREQSVSISDNDRAEILALGESCRAFGAPRPPDRLIASRSFGW